MVNQTSLVTFPDDRDKTLQIKLSVVTLQTQAGADHGMHRILRDITGKFLAIDLVCHAEMIRPIYELYKGPAGKFHVSF